MCVHVCRFIVTDDEERERKAWIMDLCGVHLLWIYMECVFAIELPRIIRRSRALFLLLETHFLTLFGRKLRKDYIVMMIHCCFAA